MARVVYLPLAGKKYPMILSMNAISRIEEEFGGIEKLTESMNYSESLGFSSAVASIEKAFGIFLEAGRTFCSCQGLEIPEQLPCSVADFMGVDDAQRLIGEVIRAGSEREVEAAPGKNGEATEEDTAAAPRGSASPPREPD